MALAAALLILAADAGSAIAADTLAVSLEESVRIALEHNKNLIVAREKINEARARVGETGTAFLPQITGSAGYTRLDVAPYIPFRGARRSGHAPQGDHDRAPRQL